MPAREAFSAGDLRHKHNRISFGETLHLSPDLRDHPRHLMSLDDWIGGVRMQSMINMNV
jgi:hypothetical protein